MGKGVYTASGIRQLHSTTDLQIASSRSNPSPSASSEALYQPQVRRF